jgi:hypothetical protein
MNKEKLINEFIDNSIKIGKLLYEGEIMEYKISNKLSDRNVVIYVQLIDNGFKEDFEELLDHENKYVRSSASIFILNGEKHSKALSITEKLSNNNDKHGRSMKEYLNLVNEGKKDVNIWNDYLEKARKKNKPKKDDKVDEITINNQQEFELPIFSNNKAEVINNHFKQNYPGCEIITLKDQNPINKHLAIDVNILTVKENEFYSVYTTGMSNFNMQIPKTLFGKYNRFKLAELLILIPLDWGNDFNSDKWKSLFKLLREVAVYPHLNNTWINDSHTLEIDMHYLTNNFRSLVLCAVEINGKVLIVNKENVVFNMIIPLYKEELDFVLKNGYNKMLEKLSETQESPFLLKLDRKCLIK